MIKSITIIGSGNVATHLAKVLYEKNMVFNQVYSRSIKNAKILANKVKAGYTDSLEGIKSNSDLYIIAVPDDAIDYVVRKLKIDKKIVVHTSGSVGVEVLKEVSKNYGSFYPLQTFTKESEISFENIPMCIEGSTKKTENELLSLALMLSNTVNKINSEQRQKLHLSAVFSCNFANYMQVVGEELCEDNQVSFDLLRPLIEETFKKGIGKLPSENQTGPAKRGDVKVIAKHLELLAGKEKLKEIYTLVSNQIKKKYITND